jgi:hypothetical protein
MSDAEETVRLLLNHYADDLTEWEHRFLTDMKFQLVLRTLTTKQQDKIDEIWDRCTKQGTRAPERTEPDDD